MQAEAIYPIINSLSREEKLKVFKMLEGSLGAPEKKPKEMNYKQKRILHYKELLKQKMFPPKK